MRTVRESESIMPGDAHLFCHVEWEEATSGISRFMASVQIHGDNRRGAKAEKHKQIILVQIDMHNMLCILPIDKRCGVNKGLSQLYLCRCWIITQMPWMQPLSLAVGRHCILWQYVIGDRSGEVGLGRNKVVHIVGLTLKRSQKLEKMRPSSSTKKLSLSVGGLKEK